MEDLCGAAVKEEAIEAKLRGVAEQWGQEAFTFADHKQRGPVVLKVGRPAVHGRPGMGRRESRECQAVGPCAGGPQGHILGAQ